MYITQIFLFIIGSTYFSRKSLKGIQVENKICSVFSQNFLTDPKPIFTKFELSTTVRLQDITVYISSYEIFFPLKILPGLPIRNKISKSY